MASPVVFCVQQTGSRSNGGVRSLSEVITRLGDHRPIVLTNLETDASQRWRDCGLEVHVEAEKASAGFKTDPMAWARSYARYHRRLRKLIANSGAKIVHCNDPLTFQLSLSAARLSGARILMNLRDTLDPARRPPRLKFRFLFAVADHVFYLSRDMARRWQAVAPNATRSCSITYSIVDPGRFEATPINPEPNPVVLVSGVFRPKKGQLDFIRKVVPVLAHNGVSTWFAGDFDPDGSAYSRECAAAAEPYRDRVRFLGYSPDMPSLLRRARVLAAPSTHEGLMRGMIEAMSCGRPVVSFDVCSAREMLESDSGRAGIVLAAGDHAGMADAILHYCRDPAAASGDGARGAATARRLFAPDQVVERYEEVYDRLEAAR